MKVLVLFGGVSPEREVSVRSGHAVIEALIEAQFEVVGFELNEDEKGLEEAVHSADVVLPILHGLRGEDGYIQKKLESMSAKYLGTDSTSSQISFDKLQTHKVLEAVGVNMAASDEVSIHDTKSTFFKKPFVLKPIDGGSSIDTLIVRTVNEPDKDKARELLRKYERMIVEELIEGQEITVPILGEEVLPPILIIPPASSEFDYENKYNGATQEICPIPYDAIKEETQQQAKELAFKVHNAMNIRHISRTDMIVEPDGKLVVLELNTIPGLSSQSLFPKSAKAAGYNMPELVTKFVELVKGDK